MSVLIVESFVCWLLQTRSNSISKKEVVENKLVRSVCATSLVCKQDAPKTNKLKTI